MTKDEFYREVSRRLRVLTDCYVMGNSAILDILLLWQSTAKSVEEWDAFRLPILRQAQTFKRVDQTVADGGVNPN